MMKLFFKDHLIWFLLLFVLFLWMNLLFVLDTGLQTVSVIYLNGTSLFIVVVVVSIYALWWRKQLKKQAFSSYHASSVMGLYEKEYERLRVELKQAENQLFTKFQEQADEQIRWIHEMKTPLTAQKLMIDALPPSPAKQQIDLEWHRLHFLLDQTLHTLRMESLEQDLILQEVSLRPLVIEEINQLRSWFLEKELEIDLDDFSVYIYSDAKWLRFILRQILSNAIKYSHVGQSIHIYSGTSQDGHTFLAIQDTGVGIEQHDLPRVFQRGFTGGYGRKQQAATGMGLYLAQNIARKLKIQLQVDSTVKQGTTVRLYFSHPNTFVDLQAI